MTREARISHSVLQRMTDKVIHRGPDGFGFEFFDEFGMPTSDDVHWKVGFGHRRLSIIDLETTGHQPMSYNDGALWITYNGEIYNYVELKEELKAAGFTFRGNSDTEVILASYAYWGTGCFSRLRGMWGLVLMDREKHRLIASRDRMGIKPLYYFVGKDLIAFGSEIKQFGAVPEFVPWGELSVIKQYILSGFERDDKTFFKSIVPVLPGTYMEIDMDTCQVGEGVSYWNPEKVVTTIHDIDTAAEEFRTTFDHSINVHLRSDVPVGCQLSGGLDSSSVIALMSRHYGGDQLHSFTVSFPGLKIDETPFVMRMLEKNRYVPHFTTPDVNRFLRESEQFAWHHDEPVGSFAHYAGFDLGRLISLSGIKVVLNGQGGDEIFGGYWQQYFTHLFSQAKAMKWTIVLGQLGGALGPGGNAELIKQIPPMLRRYLKRTGRDSELLMPKIAMMEPDNYMKEYFDWNPQTRRVFDIRRLILPRLLKWDDRNLMAFSVEGRYPILDHEVIERALQFDNHLLYHHGWTKYPIRKAMEHILPHEICYRKSKLGFETPQISWLSHGMKDQVRDWLHADKPLDQVISRKGLIDFASSFWKTKNLEDAQKLFRLYSLDQWMKLFNVRT